MKEKLDWLKGQLQTKALLRSVTTEGGTRFVQIIIIIGIGTNSWPASHARNWDLIVCIHHNYMNCFDQYYILLCRWNPFCGREPRIWSNLSS